MGRAKVSVREIGPDDTDRVSRFLHAQLNPRVPVPAWAALLRPPWATDAAPNHGVQLVDAEEQVVGAYLAVYSTRAGGRRRVCNLAAFCVVEEHRLHALRLVRSLLNQQGFVFTDLSPSGNVPAMNERLGFHHLDTTTRLVLNLPAPRGRVRVTEDPAALQATLTGWDATVYRDHREAPAARHLLVDDGNGDGHAYLMYRRDRRKRLPVFASPLHVGGNAGVLERAWPAVGSHLLARGLAATLAERRVLGFTPAGPGRQLARPRPKMYRDEPGGDAAVDYLYSELTLLQW